MENTKTNRQKLQGAAAAYANQILEDGEVDPNDVIVRQRRSGRWEVAMMDSKTREYRTRPEDRAEIETISDVRPLVVSAIREESV